MTYARCEFSVDVATTSRERAAEVVEAMGDACDIPDFIAGSGGFTWHDDECSDTTCRGCERATQSTRETVCSDDSERSS